MLTLASKSSPIHVAAKSGKIEVLKYLIKDKGGNASLLDNNRDDALTLANK
jgi:hypothetical protein